MVLTRSSRLNSSSSRATAAQPRSPSPNSVLNKPTHTAEAHMDPLTDQAIAPASPLFGWGETIRLGDEQVGLGGAAPGAGETTGCGAGDGTVNEYNGFPTLTPSQLYDLNDLLTSAGFSALSATSAVPAPAPYSFPYDSTLASSFSNPQSRALAFDAQLKSPLGGEEALSPFESPFDAYEPELEYSPAMSYAGTGVGEEGWGTSPVFSPVMSERGMGGAGEGAAVSSGVVSPQLLCGGIGLAGRNEAGMSPMLEGMSLFPGLGVNVDVGEGDFAEVDGAQATSASYPPFMSYPSHSPLPASQYSPVLSAVPSPALNDIDVSPVSLPAALPALPPAPVVVETVQPTGPPRSRSGSPSLSPILEEEEEDADKDDEGFVPPSSSSSSSSAVGGAKREFSTGPTRSSRRSTSASSPSPVPHPLIPGTKVALDAPITSRSYAITSRTSAKPLTQAMKRKMASALKRGEVVDEKEFMDEGARKRRANTLSARESRAKKAREVEELRGVKRVYEREREEWKVVEKGLRERVGELEREVKKLRRE
ncbi:hypothetical protein JCM11641_000202 [Rhodosporidiobolus odoratus]